jgi:O-succinylbenzoic acid--CoA ligase
VFTAKIYATYGMTETISHVALQPVNGSDRSDLFSPLPGVTFFTDDRGCLVIRAPYLSSEIKTNDLVQLAGENQFKWLGRWDNVINSGGIKLSPENIEERIGKIFTRLEIKNPYFIYGLPDEKLGQRVALVIEAPLPDASTLKAVNEAIIHSFSRYEIPKDFFVSDSFVYTDTAKINRPATIGTSRQVHTVLL